MRGEAFDFLSSLGTMWQVVFGAALATFGGFAATQMEGYYERRRRERNAALFLGEIISTLNNLLIFTGQTKKVGDPFGPITMRMLRSARRELDIYERNRESLIDLGDAKVRARIHSVILRVVAPLDGIFDAQQEIQSIETLLRSDALTDAVRTEASERLARAVNVREGSFEFLMETADQLGGLIVALAPLAGESFESHGEIVRNPRPGFSEAQNAATLTSAP
jgi:hypothetical protein